MDILLIMDIYSHSYSKLFDERYFMYCEFAYQTLYNFWDRVGDTLAETITIKLQQRDIDFVRVIDAIGNNSSFNNNPHFLWLKKFKENEYNSMNGDRKQTVHYETITSKMFQSHIQNAHNREEVENRQEWIEGRLGYFLHHYRQCVEGLRQFILFLETK